MLFSAVVVSYYETGDESLVSADRRTTVVPIVMAGEFRQAETNVKSVLDIVDRASGGDQFEVFITGESTISRDFVEGNQADAEKGEAFGMPIALVLSCGNHSTKAQLRLSFGQMCPNLRN